MLVDMGLVNKWVRESVGNAAMCDTLGKMIDSKVDLLRISSLSHVDSSFVLFVTGLMIFILAFICELNDKIKIFRSIKSSRAGQGLANQPKAVTGYYTRNYRL